MNLVSQSFHVGASLLLPFTLKSIWRFCSHGAYLLWAIFLLQIEMSWTFFVHGYPYLYTNTNTSKGICQEFLFSRKHPRLSLHHLGLFGIEPVRLPEQSAHLVIMMKKILVMIITRMITLGITMIIWEWLKAECPPPYYIIIWEWLFKGRISTSLLHNNMRMIIQKQNVHLLLSIRKCLAIRFCCWNPRVFTALRIFIGPRSDHSLPMSLTHWLTNWRPCWKLNELI